jgi:uncharacterized protein (DUF433 family)
MNNLLKRIHVDPKICHGQPCIRNTRILVHTVLELLEAGVTPEQIIEDHYAQLVRRDVDACLHYAALLVREAEYVPYTVASQ